LQLVGRCLHIRGLGLGGRVWVTVRVRVRVRIRVRVRVKVKVMVRVVWRLKLYISKETSSVGASFLRKAKTRDPNPSERHGIGSHVPWWQRQQQEVCDPIALLKQ
jgi:hypothetical protein